MEAGWWKRRGSGGRGYTELDEEEGDLSRESWSWSVPKWGAGSACNPTLTQELADAEWGSVLLKHNTTATDGIGATSVCCLLWPRSEKQLIASWLFMKPPLKLHVDAAEECVAAVKLCRHCWWWCYAAVLVCVLSTPRGAPVPLACCFLPKVPCTRAVITDSVYRVQQWACYFPPDWINPGRYEMDWTWLMCAGVRERRGATAAGCQRHNDAYTPAKSSKCVNATFYWFRSNGTVAHKWQTFPNSVHTTSTRRTFSNLKLPSCLRGVGLRPNWGKVVTLTVDHRKTESH